MQKSKIEWTDRTWNPVTGCTKVSEGCKFCYAETFYERFNGKGSFRNVQTHPERLTVNHKFKEPQKIFVNSMSDLFHEKVHFSFVDKVMTVIKNNPQNIYQVLTKRSKRMKEYFNEYLPSIGSDYMLPNLHMGVSVESQDHQDRIIDLVETNVLIKILSCEPLLGPLVLPIDCNDGSTFVDQVIVGGESGTGKAKPRPMHPDWVRELLVQTKKGGAAFFFKQWGAWAPHMLTKAKKLQSVFYNGFGQDMCLVGKKAAGNELDGEVWQEFPGHPGTWLHYHQQQK